MRKALLVVLLTVLLGAPTFAQESAAKNSAASTVTEAYLQQIWDGWAKLDASHQAQFYAKGEHTFFDIAPLKYTSWDEYQAGVTKELVGYKAASFTVNDDAQLHKAGDIVWGTATVKSDMTTSAGKHEMGTFRWTYIFGKQKGKWVLIHEHVSAPLP
jgi:ketosteroid isomerase-like protein